MTPRQLNRFIRYDPSTGIFRWTGNSRRQIKGKRAGSRSVDGYTIIKIHYKQYYGGRLAWYMSHGYWPMEIDHINRRKYDDRLANLREVSRSENMINSKSRPKRNIYKQPYRRQRWRVMVCRDRKQHWIGGFYTLREARKARKIFLQSRGEL